MAFQLTKAQIKAMAAHKDALREKRAQIEVEFDSLTKALVGIMAVLNERIRQYNDRVAAAQDFATEIAEEHRGEYDNKSDGWRDGERGQAADEFISAWESISLTDVDAIELVEPDAPLFDNDDLDDLPEEADA